MAPYLENSTEVDSGDAGWFDWVSLGVNAGLQGASIYNQESPDVKVVSVPQQTTANGSDSKMIWILGIFAAVFLVGYGIITRKK